MAWSEQTFYTLVKRGIQTKSGTWLRADLYTQLSYPPSQYKDFSITLTPIMALGSHIQANANSFSEVIFEPKEIITGVTGVIDGVAKVKFNKPANTDIGGIDLYDVNDNYLQGTPIEIPNGRPGEIYAMGSWVPDPTAQCYLCLACKQDAVGNPISAMFTIAEKITVAAKTVSDDNPGKSIFAAWDFFTSVPGWPYPS